MVAFIVKKKMLKCPAFSVEGRKGSLFGEIHGSKHLLGKDKMYLVSRELLLHVVIIFLSHNKTKIIRKHYQFSLFKALRLWGIVKKSRATEKSCGSKQTQGEIDFPLLPMYRSL